MRLPNITSSNSIIQKIKELDQQRFKLDAQITSGQKIALPEDDGMRLGRVIQLETQKVNLLNTSEMHPMPKNIWMLVILIWINWLS